MVGWESLQAVEVRQSMARLLSNIAQINCTDTSSQQRLMGISPGSVHEQSALVLANSLGEGLGSLFDDDVSPALLAWLGNVNLVTSVIQELGDNDVGLKLRLPNLAFDATAVDRQVTEVRE